MSVEISQLPPTIIDLNGKVSPTVLADHVFGVNISMIYQEVNKGRLPGPIKDYTYKQAIQAYIKHFKEAQDVKLQQEANAHELRLKKLEEDLKSKSEKLASNRFRLDVDGNIENDLHPLVKKKMEGDIRLNSAKEEQIWLKIAIERGDYISRVELENLLEPFMVTIRDMLISLTADYPSVEKRVDQVMQSLHAIGVSLVEGSREDRDKFIKAMMEKDLENV